MGFIKVLIEQTGVEMCVPEEYYEKYKASGIRFLEEVDSNGESLYVKRKKEKVEEPTHEQLKVLCKSKGLTFKGNASKAELKSLLED